MLRAGLVGLGAMGRHHARILSTLDNVNFIGVVDVKGDNPDDARGRPIFSDIAELIALRPDYVVVACPTSFHAQVATQLAEAGVAVLVEKPMCNTIDEATALVKTFAAAGVIGGVGHIERYNPAIRELKKRLQEGELGNIYQIATRRQGPFPQRISDVGVVKDLATHDIDLTGWITDSTYESLSAYTVSRSMHPHEDMVSAVGKLANGVVCSHTVNWLTPFKERSTIVTGDKGCFIADTLTGDLTFHANGVHNTQWDSVSNFRGVSEGNMVRYAIPKREPLQVEHENFRDAVMGVGGDIVTLEQGLQAVTVSSLFLESAATGATIANLVAV